MGDDTTVITKNAQETAEVGQSMATSLKAHVICLYGDLGSGKTTFVQGFARGLGVTRRLPSPTFIIVRRYEIPGRSGFLYHIDLYRIHDEKELEGLGVKELFEDANSYVLVEWAERLGTLMPKKRVDIRFDLLDNENHNITLCHHE